jgi:hypothetical protein
MSGRIFASSGCFRQSCVRIDDNVHRKQSRPSCCHYRKHAKNLAKMPSHAASRRVGLVTRLDATLKMPLWMFLPAIIVRVAWNAEFSAFTHKNASLHGALSGPSYVSARYQSNIVINPLFWWQHERNWDASESSQDCFSRARDPNSSELSDQMRQLSFHSGPGMFSVCDYSYFDCMMAEHFWLLALSDQSKDRKSIVNLVAGEIWEGGGLGRRRRAERLKFYS